MGQSHTEVRRVRDEQARSAGGQMTVVVAQNGQLHPPHVPEPLPGVAAGEAQRSCDSYAGLAEDQAVVSANRSRIEELRRRRYGVPDFADILAAGSFRAIVLLGTCTLAARLVLPVAWPQVSWRGAVLVPAVFAVVVWCVGSHWRRRRR